MRKLLRSSISALKTQTKIVGLVTIGVVTGGAATALVQAAIPDARGGVRMCYTSSTTRIIDGASTSCGTGESSVTVAKFTPGNYLPNLSGAYLVKSDLSYKNFRGGRF